MWRGGTRTVPGFTEAGFCALSLSISTRGTRGSWRATFDHSPARGSDSSWNPWPPTSARPIGAGELAFSERGAETVFGRKTRALEAVFAKERAEAYDGYRFVINQDAESKIPVRIRVYDRDAQLVENYSYENLVLNAPLADADFDPKNPAYQF